jgi:hypothetical protein
MQYKEKGMNAVNKAKLVGILLTLESGEFLWQYPEQMLSFSDPGKRIYQLRFIYTINDDYCLTTWLSKHWVKHPRLIIERGKEIAESHALKYGLDDAKSQTWYWRNLLDTKKRTYASLIPKDIAGKIKQKIALVEI